MALSRRTGARFQASIWPGFVDAMTGLLLVLMFVLTIFMFVQFVLRETISGQASELDALSLEVKGLAQALGLEQDKNADLTERVGKLTATLGDARQFQEQQDALITSLQSARAAQDQALGAARARIASFEEQVASLLADRKANLGQIDKLESQRDTLQSEQEQLQLALAGLRQEVDQQSEAARLAAARREALEALIVDLKRKNSEGANAQQALAGKISTLEVRLSEEEQARLAEAAAAEALREKLKNADSELTAMTLALEEERRKAEETLTMLAAAETAGKDLDLQLAAALLALDKSENSLSAVQGDAVEKDRRIAALEDNLTGTRADLAAVTTELEEVQKALEESGAQLAQAQSGQKLMASQLSVLEQKLARALAATDEKETALAALQAQLDAVEVGASDAAVGFAKEKAGLEARISEAEAALARVSATLTDAESEREALRHEKKSLEGLLAEALAAKVVAENGATENAGVISDLKVQLEQTQAELAAVKKRLAQQIAARTAADAKALDAAEVRKQLAAALAAKLKAQKTAQDRLSTAEERAVLLAKARDALSQQEGLTEAAQRQQALLNNQVAALRQQLASLQALLDESKASEAAQGVQLQTLGRDLNAALARVAAEERKRRKLEEEKNRLLAQEKQDLEKYRSEFFGRLRDVLGHQEGVRIVGDRFVFSSEVLFAPGEAKLSGKGQQEIAKVANILRKVVDDIPPEIDWVIRVDGHTDDVPLLRGAKFADNWELSQARALSVVRYMINALDIPPGRLSANGFGEYQPINPADTPEARAQNRRIELKFTEK